MRRWLAVLTGVAAIAVTGTALALNGVETNADEEPAPETKVRIEEATTTTVNEVEVETVNSPVAAVEAEEKEPTSLPEKDPIDNVPPEIAILHPGDGQAFEVREVVFEGVTEPGARVFAGEHEADVTEEGAWRIVLVLAPGENEVNVKAKDASGNYATAWVTVAYHPPQNVEEPKEQPKEDEQPKEEDPKEHEAEWVFAAYQVYGECEESPPYDVFHGTGKPGSGILVQSEYGSADVRVGENGQWEIKVFFETAPAGQAFPVKVRDEFGNHQVFEFIRTG